MLQAVFTPSFSGVRATVILDFCIENLGRWRDYVGMQYLDEKHVGFERFGCLHVRRRLSNTAAKNLEVNYLQTVAETPIKWMLLSTLDQMSVTERFMQA